MAIFNKNSSYELRSNAEVKYRKIESLLVFTVTDVPTKLHRFLISINLVFPVMCGDTRAHTHKDEHD